MNIENIVEQMLCFNDSAYRIYKTQVDTICKIDATEDEVSHLLDYMLDFCGDERMLMLFKKVCRIYYKKYPELISFQINAYREYYDTDKEVTDD